MDRADDRTTFSSSKIANQLQAITRIEEDGAYALCNCRSSRTANVSLTRQRDLPVSYRIAATAVLVRHGNIAPSPDMPRKSITLQVETAVLTLSRRRCALCFGLHADFEVKRGQIAHIDRNADNSAIENLAFLCIPHHDEYDSTTRQSKGLTAPELKRYRQELYKLLGQRLPRKDAEKDEYRAYERFVPARWRHIYTEALEFYSGATHRMASAVLALADGEKNASEINAGIPPSNLDWTTVILNDAVQQGFIEKAGPDKFRLTLYSKVILEALAEIPDAVKEDAWRLNWFPSVVVENAFELTRLRRGTLACIATRRLRGYAA